MKLKSTLAMLALLTLPMSALAQDGDENNKDNRGRVVKVDKWTIKSEVSTLTNSMKQFNGLINSLSKANKDLSVTFKQYLNDPDNELLASKVEKKLAAYAANVSKEFDTIIATQDVFTSNFRNLRHKLGQLGGHLKTKSAAYKDQLLDYKKKAKTMEKSLIDLAMKVKDPDLDPAERTRLKREFAIQHRRFMMQERYVKGYSSRYKGYVRLQKNMSGLGGLFGGLHSKFEDLIKNLENEKKYLRDSIELHADTLRIKKLMREGIVGGEKAIVNVSKKLATLYLKVDTFNEVHDRISQQMNRFMDSQGAVMGVTDKVNSIGTTGIGFGALNKDLDKLIDDFANKKDSIDDDELDVEGGKGDK
jgi:hypothetical protein